MTAEHIHDDRPGFIDVRAIGNTETHIDASNGVVAVVDDLLAPDLSVGQTDVLIIKRLKIRGEEVDIGNQSELARYFCKVSHAIRAEDQQHDASGKVGHGTLKR